MTENKMTIPVYNVNGEKIEEKALMAGIAEQKISKTLLHEVVIAYLANRRKGLACAKTKAEVSGGGAKPWNQKGTGRARAGSTRSPLFRGGGVVFGPRPRSYRQYLPKKKYIAALSMAVKSKIEEEGLFLVRGLKLEDHKTKKIQQVLDKFKVNGEKALLVISAGERNIKLAARNINNLELVHVEFLNAYNVLWAKKVIFMEGAFEKLNKLN